MNLDQFRESLSQASPPALPVHLTSLWYDAKGDWETSHQIIQDVSGETASWIHAYLHRKEGDTGNADYWYRRAGRKRPSVSPEQEWEQIVLSFLND
jgi:hypothetical protein